MGIEIYNFNLTRFLSPFPKSLHFNEHLQPQSSHDHLPWTPFSQQRFSLQCRMHKWTRLLQKTHQHEFNIGTNASSIIRSSRKRMESNNRKNEKSSDSLTR